MTTNFVFLNVDDPALFKQGENKSLVQSHVGKYNRLKSKNSRPVDKSERLDRLIALRAKNLDRDPNLVPGTIDQASSLKGSEPRILPRIDEEQHDIRTRDVAKPSSPIAEMIQILPVSQQMNYGSSPTLSPRSVKPTSGDSGEDEVGDEVDLIRDWIASTVFCPGQGRVDPFARWSVDTDDSKLPISQLVDHATSGFWSLLTPHNQFGPRNPANRTYLEHMHHSVLAFYCYTIAISHNFDFLSDLPSAAKKYRSLRAKHLHAATKLVRKYIESLPADPKPEQIPDELIGSVLTLAGNYRVTVYSRESRSKSKFLSPLATLQCLDMWGLLPLLPPHRLAVIQLVNLKGGLRAIQSADLAGVVQFIDLMDASRHLTRPMLPWENIGIPLPIPDWPFRSVFEPQPAASNLTKAFEDLPADVLGLESLGLAISVTAHTADHLTQYFMAECPQPAMVMLCESRNRAQYLVSALQPISVILRDDQLRVHKVQKDLTSLERHLYEITRLTLLIFNNLVVFPLPPHSGLDTRLSRLLRDELHTALADQPNLKSQHPELLLWAMILGGISDYHDLQRSWYIEAVRDVLSTATQFRKWTSMLHVLTSFLWSDVVLNKEAFRFWLEINISDSRTAESPTTCH